MDRDDALEMVKKFRERPGINPVFLCLKRPEVADGLEARVKDPSKIDQGAAGLCGPASLLYDTAVRSPKEYAQYAIDLFEKGEAKLGKIDVKPNDDLKKASKGNFVEACDWMTMASLRNSQNSPLFTYKQPGDEFSGITMPHEMADWLDETGFTDIQNHTNVYFTKSETNAKDASAFFLKGYKVFLFINANMLSYKHEDESSFTPDHWVYLRSSINMSNRNHVRLTIYTWGNENYQVPHPSKVATDPEKPFPLETFLKNYYGYVAARH